MSDRTPRPTHRARWTDRDGIKSDWMDATDVRIEAGCLCVSLGRNVTWMPVRCIGGPIEIEVLPDGLA